MSHAPLESLVCQLRKATAAQTLDEMSDGELLKLYQQGQDEAAFAALVRRHGRLIASACHQLLDDAADVDDVFQATFLVFVREAKRIRDGAALGGWLYRVAYRIALRLRQKRSRQFELVDAAEQEPDLSWRDACAVLHAELDRLPDKFRLPLVLCYLDGRSRDEAAKHLGWSEGMVKGRLERGRNLLRSRLVRRGVSLSAGLLGVLSAKRADAVAPHLVNSVVEFATKPPARSAVIALAQGVPSMINPMRKWLIAATILAIGLLGGGAWLAAKPRPADPPKEPEKPQAEKPAESPHSRVVKGRIVDPDGKPVAGARLYRPTLKVEQPRSLDELEMPQCGTSGKDGEFRVELPANEKGRDLPIPILVIADGFGVNWIDGPKFAETAYTVRLPKTNPIAGRVIDTQGKPLADLTVVVTAVIDPGHGKLNEFLEAWKRESQTAIHSGRVCFAPLNKVLGTAKTDDQGRFELRGVGIDHLAEIEIAGSGAAQNKLYVVNQPGFDPKPVNNEVLSRRPPLLGSRELLYSPRAEYVAIPSKPIEGIVTDANTGKPIADVRISASTRAGSRVQARTDDQGRYRLVGLSKWPTYFIHANPPQNDPSLLSRTMQVTDNEALAPIRFDFVLNHGVILTGRVIDRATGKGVRSAIRWVPLPDNAYFGKKPGYDVYRYERAGSESDSQGRFKFAAIPGMGVLMAQTSGRDELAYGNPFRPFLVAEFSEEDAKKVTLIENGLDRQAFIAAGGSLEILASQQAIRYADIKENAGTVNIDLFVYRGKTRKLKILDPDGKPLDGATISGMTASFPITFPGMKSECTIYALSPKESRLVVVYHPQRKLGSTIRIDGSSSEPLTIKLSPVGSLKGRLVDADDQPVAGVTVSESYAAEAGRELIRHMQPPKTQVKTDAEGRFQIDGLVPGLEFSLGMRKDRKFFIGGEKVNRLKVESGQIHDLGEVKVKSRE